MTSMFRRSVLACAGVLAFAGIGGRAAMAEVTYSLSDEEIEALAHYLAHL